MFKRTQQKGAALFICLTLLTIMSILGISAISTTTLEEKMAGNLRNKHISFQAAETALRAAEGIAAGLAGESFDSTNGLYPESQYDDDPADAGVYATFPVWDDTTSSVTWQDVSVTGLPVDTDPQYIIEDYGESPRDDNCQLQQPMAADCMLPVYRITAKGSGLNQNAESMVQSTYKQL